METVLGARSRTAFGDGWVRSACTICMNRCGILAHVNEENVVDKILGDPDNPHNHGRTCAKGDAGFEGLTDPDRITIPLRRTNPEKGVGVDPGWMPISWDEALDEIAGHAVPLQFLLSSAAMSVAVVLLVEVIAGEPVSAGQMVLLAVLTAALLVTVVQHLVTRTSVPGKKESLDWLLRGQYRGLFVGFVVAAGTALPLVLALAGAAASGARDALAVICCVLLVPGGCWLRLVTLRVGIYPPVHIPSVHGPRSAASTAGG